MHGEFRLTVTAGALRLGTGESVNGRPYSVEGGGKAGAQGLGRPDDTIQKDPRAPV